jgi:hypothetical protein
MAEKIASGKWEAAKLWRTTMKIILIFMMLIGASAQAGENGTTIKSDSLKASPFADGNTLATLPSGTHVEILKKDGGWFQVKSSKGSGWMRMLSIHRGDAKSAGNELSGLASLASGRAGTGKIVATTGIRGLNEEELKAAKYDEKQVSLAESYASTRTEAQKFAAAAKLKPQQVSYLPNPTRGE